MNFPNSIWETIWIAIQAICLTLLLVFGGMAVVLIVWYIFITVGVWLLGLVGVIV